MIHQSCAKEEEDYGVGSGQVYEMQRIKLYLYALKYINNHGW